MREQYERIKITITAFDAEDVITTSGIPEPTANPEDKISVDYGDELPFGTWY